jgi:hypothetical protein
MVLVTEALFRQMNVCHMLLMQAPEDSTGRQRDPVDWRPVLAAMALSPQQKRAAHEARLALGEGPLQVAHIALLAIRASCLDDRQSPQLWICRCVPANFSCICVPVSFPMHVLASSTHVLLRA